MNMHLGSPQQGAQTIPVGLAIQEANRREALETVRRLRKEASAEIERLLSFMDETDGYTMTECEPSLGQSEPDAYDRRGFDQDRGAGNADDLEMPDDDEPSLCGVTATASYYRGVEIDAEAEQDDEPSLGSLSSSGGSQAVWGIVCEGGTDAEDEHDGAEPENEGGESFHEDDEDNGDREPMLGWTEAGCVGNTSSATDECEVVAYV